MIDPELLRKEPERIREAARLKGFDPETVDLAVTLDRRRRELLAVVERLRAERNALSKRIGSLPPEERHAALTRATVLKERLAQLEPELRDVQNRLQHLLLCLPNPPAPSSPVGSSDEDNVEIRRWGQPPSFPFPPRDHLELGRLLGIIETERAVKLAGSRAYFLKNEGALLEWAVLRFAVDLLLRRGYTLLAPPVLVLDEAMTATGYFPLGREEVYRLERDELNLVGTAEVPLVAYHMDETLEENELPRRYCALSPCFRREVGSAGRDVHGLYRVHQFFKVEQVIICEADPDASRRYHEELLKNAEDILQALELPYRVVQACTGDMGQGQVLKHDVETWMPSRGRYGETHSCSSFHDFQARRARIRYRDRNGRVRYAYTLNNTAVASPRILIPLLEIHQREDGSVRIPEALRPYMGGLEALVPRVT
ncbi:serine--tRNA ligase [Thermaerobacter subterraneus]|uniref:Serine--tRNA ligase n=1 Tax=Thermaerobacter subterraneus DSM 13965 TaxID=867903 RepID=K6Q2W3_9FIRM|nr:serine--tRNA ligase [Thermaerobacter subterraneus]EKP95394.1 seryl-tRNA synthetase [Thermaerobacter subterraneus DSM 13965]